MKTITKKELLEKAIKTAKKAGYTIVNETSGQYKWNVISPDGRIVFSEIGGREAEARAKSKAQQFNETLPHGAKQATVKMVPSTLIEDEMITDGPNGKISLPNQQTPDTKAFINDCRRLARRKHRKSWFMGLTPDGEFSIWKGMTYGNEWKYTWNEVKLLLKNGARKPV